MDRFKSRIQAARRRRESGIWAERGRGVSSSAAEGAGRSLLTWRVSSWAALVLAGIFLIVCLGRLVVLIRDRQLVDRIVADAHSVPIRDGLNLVRAESTVNVLLALTGFALAVTFGIFYVTSRQLLRHVECDVHTVMWHWSVAAWQIGVTLTVLWGYFGKPGIPSYWEEAWRNHGRAMAWQSADRERILFAAFVVVVQALFVLAIWVRRKRISTMITQRIHN